MNSSDGYAITVGGWRDSQLRKNLNDESTGTIWNAIQSNDFKNNITPVLKTTNNNYSNKDNNSGDTSNASNITVDKLYILSPSEMGMPIMKDYKEIYGYGSYYGDANVHYYNSDSYKNTIKSSNDGNEYKLWSSDFNYLYDDDAYQWWMLPSGSRRMSNDSQAYHNTDSYSYCALSTISNPSDTNIIYRCDYDYHYYWLRSVNDDYSFAVYRISFYNGDLATDSVLHNNGVVVSFSF